MNLSYEKMVRLATSGLQAAGIGEHAAFETAQFLVLAELDGLASHGLARVAQYAGHAKNRRIEFCLLYTSPSPRDGLLSRMPSSA